MMGLFGLREEKTDKDVQQEQLYAARNAYDDRRTAFRDVGDTIELDCLEGLSWLIYKCVRLRIDSDAFVLFPEVNPYDFADPEALDRLTEIRLPRTVYRLEHTPPVREPVKEEGDHLFFQWPKFEVRLTGEQNAVLRAHDLHRACTFFAKYPNVVSAHALFDLWDGPDYSVVFSRENPPAGCPSGRYDICVRVTTCIFTSHRPCTRASRNFWRSGTGRCPRLLITGHRANCRTSILPRAEKSSLIMAPVGGRT